MPCVVILTALPIECDAVHAYLIAHQRIHSYLATLQEEVHPPGTVYHRGEFSANGQTWTVGIAEVGAGNTNAAAEAVRAIEYFKPDLIFFVGIARGIKDVAIGDVVAATKVYGYEYGEVTDRFRARPEVGKSAYALEQRAKAEARDKKWVRQLPSSPTQQPNVYVAPIAAGEKIVVSEQSDIFRFLRESYSDAVAIEMEGFGFLSAVFAYPEVKQS
jgi:nucleoside phosphorylase